MNHYISNINLRSEIPHGFNEITFGAGCFWGVEEAIVHVNQANGGSFVKQAWVMGTLGVSYLFKGLF